MGGERAFSYLVLLVAAASLGTCSGSAAARDAVPEGFAGLDSPGQGFFHVHDLSTLASKRPGNSLFLPWLDASFWKNPFKPLNPVTTTSRPVVTTTSRPVVTTTSRPVVPPPKPSKKPPRPSRPSRPSRPTNVAEPPSNVANRTFNPDSILGYDIPCGVRNVEESDRIVGGSDADRGEFPWQISLQRKKVWSLQHICGGAILAPYWVVTAGHCVDRLQPSELTVVAGDHDLYKIEGSEQRRQVVRIVGLGYDRNTFARDISLLQLDKRLQFNARHVAPICVPRPEHQYLDGNAVVAGWGRLSESGGLPQRLQQVSLPLVPWETCKRNYQSKGFSKFLHTCQICSGLEQGGQDSCQGDSGGPLACREADGRYYLCGVVSWGIGCARAEFPGVYTEVSCYARWINEILYNEHHILDPEKSSKQEESRPEFQEVPEVPEDLEAQE